jgi:hypothetical protein
MSKRSVAKIQHYVPQFLLKNFRFKKSRIYVFDKKSGKKFVTNVRNVACQSRFYDFEFEGEPFTLESSLSKIESAAKPHIDTILESDSLLTLSPEARAELCIFFSVQFTRTLAFRERWREIPELIGEKLKAMVDNEEQLENVSEYIRSQSENEVIRDNVQFIMRSPEQFAVHFATKSWLLVATAPKRPFFIGDDPITLQNQIKSPFAGNLGLACQGIEMYFPLSPTRALAMLCPSHKERLQDLVGEVARLRAGLSSAESMVKAMYVENMLAALESGEPFAYTTGNVENFNALQILHSERFVFSSSDNFHLAEKIITKHPKARSGRRVTVN